MPYEVEYKSHTTQIDNFLKSRTDWWGRSNIITLFAQEHIYVGLDSTRRTRSLLFRDEKHYLMFMLRYS